MKELYKLWVEFREKNKKYHKGEIKYEEYKISVDALNEVGNKIIPSHDLLLIDAGMEATCCCNNGITNVEAWCALAWKNV